MIQYTIINSALNAVIPEPMNKEILHTIHNAGFFSNCSIRLMDIVSYYNKSGRLPDEVDSSTQWLHYKGVPSDRPDLYYFTHQDAEGFDFVNTPYIDNCMAFQFNNYKQIKHDQLNPFLTKYFTPSEAVLKQVKEYENKYELDYDNLCAVFYRGNDKVTETEVSPYSFFIEKAREIKSNNPNIKFLIQPDESEFLQAFINEFPNSIAFSETPHMKKQMSAVFFEQPLHKRMEYGKLFFSAVLTISRCRIIITHSGNCGLWAAIYRGNSEGIHQIFENKWL